MAEITAESSRNAREILVKMRRQASNEGFQQDMRARTHVVKGHATLAISGDAIVHVAFPVRFFNRPHFTYGAQMVENSEIIEGVFPSMTAMVLRYNKEELPTNTDVDEHALYTGADIAVSARGSVSNGFILDFRFEGVAMVNPTSGVQDDELTDEL